MRYLFLLLASFALTLPLPAGAATPPGQPKSGPGSAMNANAEVVKRAVGRASAPIYVYHLAGDAAEPRPVVVFLHAWGAVNPQTYGGWIDHLARRGYLVLFPIFQELGRTRPLEAGPVAASRVKDALAALASDSAARPDPARLAYIGHTAGVGVAMYMAGAAAKEGLPNPKLVFGVMPGGIASDEKSRGVQMGDLSKVDPSVSVVTLVGDREFQASDRLSRRILRETENVPPSRKLFMRAASDDHGFPTMSATLASPASPKSDYDPAAIKLPPDPPVDPRAPRPQRPRWSADMVLSGEQQVLLQQLGRNGTDTLDYLAFWRSFDFLAEAAFSGLDMTSVRANPAFADMGRWSDGWPVKRLAVETPKADAAPRATSAVTPAAAAPPSAKNPVTRQRREAR
jgi:dienelactone hydrolase